MLTDLPGEAIPISDITTETVAQAFSSGWISRFGVPSTITTDHGGGFESTIWAHLMRLLGTNCIRTTAYHPSANGLVERFHRQLKGTIKCLPDTTQWIKAIPPILLGIRTSIKQDCRCTPADLVYGTTLRLPGEFFNTIDKAQLDTESYATQLQNIMQKLQPPDVCKQAQRSTHVHTDLSPCPFVFVRHDGVKETLQPPYDKVLQRTNIHFTLDISGRLKPAYMDTPPFTDTNTPPTSSKTLNS